MKKKPKKRVTMRSQNRALRKIIDKLNGEIEDMKYAHEHDRKAWQETLFNSSISRDHWAALQESLSDAKNQVQHQSEMVAFFKGEYEKLKAEKELTCRVQGCTVPPNERTTQDP